MKKKLLFLFHTYPQNSQTYILEEVNAIYDLDLYDILILSGEPPNGHAPNHKPYSLIRNVEDMISKAVEFNPDIIHTHYIHMIPLVETISGICDSYYTIRTHSYDVLGAPYAPINILCSMAKSERCLRILTFPLCKKILLDNGVPPEKVVECFPVINYDRFVVDPNIPHKQTNTIVNVGAAIKKKKFKDYIDLAILMNKDPENKQIFNLYALGYFVNDLKKYNNDNGSYVNFYSTDPEDMKDVYTSSDWLIYTADPEMPTVGWPLAIAEAQAAGIGIIWKNIPGREEFSKQYLGGAGFLFDDISEIPNIIKNGYPDSMRRIGIEHAKKCDIHKQLHLLTDVWENPLSQDE